MKITHSVVVARRLEVELAEARGDVVRLYEMADMLARTVNRLRMVRP